MGVGICTSLTQSLPSEGGIGVGGCKAMLLSPDSVDWALPESFQLTLAVCYVVCQAEVGVFLSMDLFCKSEKAPAV